MQRRHRLPHQGRRWRRVSPPSRIPVKSPLNYGVQLLPLPRRSNPRRRIVRPVQLSVRSQGQAGGIAETAGIDLQLLIPGPKAGHHPHQVGPAAGLRQLPRPGGQIIRRRARRPLIGMGDADINPFPIVGQALGALLPAIAQYPVHHYLRVVQQPVGADAVG